MTDILILTHIDYCPPAHLGKVLEQAGHAFTVLRADLGELEEMVSELLTYASLERGATVITRENIQAHSWLDSVVGSVALEATLSSTGSNAAGQGARQ